MLYTSNLKLVFILPGLWIDVLSRTNYLMTYLKAGNTTH